MEQIQILVAIEEQFATWNCLRNDLFSGDICMLHLNELPLLHIFTVLDGTTKSPHKFSSPIGSMFHGLLTQWEVANFKPISC